jgi:hypothetical protein
VRAGAEFNRLDVAPLASAGASALACAVLRGMVEPRAGEASGGCADGAGSSRKGAGRCFDATSRAHRAPGGSRGLGLLRSCLRLCRPLAKAALLLRRRQVLLLVKGPHRESVAGEQREIDVQRHAAPRRKAAAHAAAPSTTAAAQGARAARGRVHGEGALKGRGQLRRRKVGAAQVNQREARGEAQAARRVRAAGAGGGRGGGALNEELQLQRGRCAAQLRPLAGRKRP